jgi:hypothetical protein
LAISIAEFLASMVAADLMEEYNGAPGVGRAADALVMRRT